MEFPQSCARFWKWLGIPAFVAIFVLTRTGLWGLWVFPESQFGLRLAFGFGPLLWALGLVAFLCRMVWLNQGVCYEITATRLVRRQGGRVQSMKLSKTYVNRQSGRFFPWLRISDGQQGFSIQALFMPRYEEFANLLEVGSRIRRSEETL